MSQVEISDVKITNEKNVTKGDIIREASKMWKEAQDIWNGIKTIGGKKNKNKGKVKISSADHQKLDEIYRKMREEHKEFATSYPTVMRHMIQDKWFDIKAFREYMDSVEKNPWTNDSERMDSYTHYAVLLMRNTSKSHVNVSTLNAFKRDYRMRLQNEHDQFMQDYEKYKAQVEMEAKNAEMEKRIDLMTAFKRLAPQSGISEEKVKDMEELVKNNMIKTSALETLVYDIRRVLAGENIDKIRKENEEHRRKLEEKAKNIQIESLGEKMASVHEEKIKELAAAKIKHEIEEEETVEVETQPLTTSAPSTDNNSSLRSSSMIAKNSDGDSDEDVEDKVKA